MSRPEPSRRRVRSAALPALALVTLALVSPAAPALAAEVRAEAEIPFDSLLGERVLARFRADALREGVLLRPLVEETEVRSIELVDDGEVLVNGREVDTAEVAEILGDDAGLVLELARLDAGARRRALGFAAPEARAVARDGGARVGVDASGTRVRVSREDRVSVGRSITVEEGETARDVICVGCSIELAGEAFGDAVAVGGHLDVTGTVHGDAVAVGGSVDVGDGAAVLGDAVAVGGALDVAPGGQVVGQRSSVGIGDGWFDGWGGGWGPVEVFSSLNGLFWSIFRAGLLALLVGLCVLIARPSVEASARRVEREPWKALFAGLLTQLLFFPVLLAVSVVLAVSIIGLPLLVLVPVAILILIVGNLVGFAAVATVAGRAVERRFGATLSGPFLVAVLGVVAIQMISIVGRLVGLPGGVVGFIGLTVLALGFCVKYVAWTLGLGSMALVAMGREWREPARVQESAPIAAAPRAELLPASSAPEAPERAEPADDAERS